MASLLLFYPLSVKTQHKYSSSNPQLRSLTATTMTPRRVRIGGAGGRMPRSSLRGMAVAYKVTIEHEGRTTTVDVDEGESILGRALDEGLVIPHDCKLGVCMTCPARLVSGKVDQSEGMLSEDVVEKGYALLCASYPRSDCHIKIIPEEELLSLQLVTSND